MSNHLDDKNLIWCNALMTAPLDIYKLTDMHYMENILSKDIIDIFVSARR